MSETVVRPARAGDEAEIANVHLNSWREAYRVLLPQEFLDGLPLTFKRRMSVWRRLIEDPTYVVQVAENQNGIVGFASFSAGRDPGFEKHAELQAIYLLAAHKGKGVGFRLLMTGFIRMLERKPIAAYCWVLEGNPTIAFYERSGGKPDGRRKADEIGGRKVVELAYSWDISHYNWQPYSVEEAREVLRPMSAPWWIAGGRAIDLFLGRETREHEDIDISIKRADQLELQKILAGWDLWVADPSGTLRPWKTDEFLGNGIQDIWARENAAAPWRLQFMLFDVEGEDWVFKRDESVRRSLSTYGMATQEGLRILSPEIQLLYKSRALREKDELDFNNVLEALGPERRAWLKDNLTRVYAPAGHRWIERL